MKKALIFGTTDFAQVAAVYLRDDSEYEVEAFVVNEAYVESAPASIMEKPVISFERAVETHRPSEFSMYFGIGFSKVNANRRGVYEACKAAGYTVPSYVHSTVARWPETQIGEACFIFENNVIQPFVTIGNNCVLWSGNHIGHHSRIGDNVFIASHVVVSGRCAIGDNTFVGVNATFRDGITIGADCVIGAGAILLKDTIAGSVYKSTATEPYVRRSDELRNF